MKPHYLCLKSSKNWQCKKGKVYVHEFTEDRGGWGELVNYNQRWQSRLLNGSLMLAQPGMFTKTFPPFDASICDCDGCREARK